MSTYSQLREQVLILLDKTGDTGDIKTAVDYTLKQVVDELVSELRPESLIQKTSYVSVTSATTSIALGVGGFSVTSYEKLLTLTIDYQDVTPAVERDQTFIPWTSWIRESDDYYGITRLEKSWTIDPSLNIYLRTWPGSGETWKTYLYYYSPTAAVTDNGTPEIPAIHHQTIVFGAVTRFPNFFQGDRASLLPTYLRNYEAGKARYLRDRGNAKRDLRLRPANAQQTSGTFWPTDILPIT